MDREVNIRDRVILNPRCGYTLGEGNPEYGSEYSCEGTVESIVIGKSLPVRVLWDNGSSNGYNFTNLTVIGKGKDNPNVSFRLKKERGK
jgi:hypothetical protein